MPIEGRAYFGPKRSIRNSKAVKEQLEKAIPLLRDDADQSILRRIIANLENERELDSLKILAMERELIGIRRELEPDKTRLDGAATAASISIGMALSEFER